MMPADLSSSDDHESMAAGFQGWPEYSEPGDWLELEYNAGVPPRPTAPQIEQGDQDSSTSGSSPPVSIALIAASVEVSSLK